MGGSPDLDARCAIVTEALYGPLPPHLLPTPVVTHDAEPYVEPVANQLAQTHAGYQELIRGENPPPGTRFRFVVTGAETVVPLSVMVTLTTSAAVADRACAVEYWDKDGVRFVVAGANVTVPASQAQTFGWFRGAGGAYWPVTDAALAPLPAVMLFPLQSLVVRVVDMDAADQLSTVQLALERFPT